MQLEPREFFTIARQIADHTDSTTYFVRAVVRNARTDALLETVDLTDQGSQRFSKEYQVPADTSGLGFYISITSSVYTDSGFTTKSENYGDEANIYLVQQRNQNLGGGHSVFTDFGKMKEILDVGIADTIDKIPKEEKQDVHSIIHSIVGAGIAELKEEFRSINIPEQKETDLSSLEDKISASGRGILAAIANIHIPEPEKLDLTEALTAIKEIKTSLENSNFGEPAMQLIENLEKILTKRIPEMEELLDSLVLASKEAFIFYKVNAGVKPRKKFKGFEKIL